MRLIQHLLFFVSISLFFHCQKDELKLTTTDLTGNWEEKEPEDIGQFGGTNHTLEFKADSTFELALYRWTDVIDINDTCPDTRTDYIVGAYALTADSLSLTGQYADSTFQTIQPNCDGETSFAQTYTYKKNSDDVILNFEKSIYEQIRLVKQ